MNAESNNEKELLQLCGLMVDGGLDDADMQRLSELLTSDASAREFYRSYMDAHARLLLHYEPVPVLDEPLEEPVHQLAAARERLGHRSSSLQFVAAAALLLMTGLNVIQSAGNREAARRPTPQMTRVTDSESRRLAEEIDGLTPNAVKRTGFLSSQRDWMLMLPIPRR